MNTTLSPSWINGNYIVNGYQVTINTNLSVARFQSIETDDDYYFQGSEADDVINEIADIWENANLKQDESIDQWIRLHL